MTAKKLIEKMLANGFTKLMVENHYGKKVGDIVVEVHITESETISGGWIMPMLREWKNGSILDTGCFWNANGLNQALCKRNYF